MKRMKTILLVILLVLPAALSAGTREGGLIGHLDSLMDHVDDLYARKQASIDMLKGSIARERDPRVLLSAYDRLFGEYYVFQFDSAMVYVDKAITLADASGDRYHHDKSRIDKASLLAIGGLYGEATSLLAEIDSTSLDERLRFDYTLTHYYIYLYWSDYCHDATYAPRYRRRAAGYLSRAVRMLRPDDARYDFYMGEYYIYVDRDDAKALHHYFRTLSKAPVASRWYAMASFAIANNYSANHDTVRYEEYLTRACISDLLNCTRENLALQDLAMYLYNQGEENIKRAERYINFAMDDAKTYNNRLRIIEISQKLPAIVSNYREKVTSQYRYMRAALWCISALFTFVMLLLYFYSRQNRQLSLHRHELSSSNEKLSSLNDRLHLLNGRLLDTNVRRERLAKLYIDLCANYIDRLSRFELLVRRKIKAGQVGDLLSMATSSKLSEDDAATFMHRFDAAFLDLYPSFVTEFNALLRPGEQLLPPHAGRLTTELRIFALIRLGVKESSEIAALLFYTPRTIYNYRSSVKARARNRDTFEDDVARLCTVIRTDDTQTEC